MSKPLPGRPAHDLELPTVGGKTWKLADQRPENFTMIVFYRGHHCPICKTQLRDLESKLDQFEKRGVIVFVASCDDEQRARQSVQEWGVDRLDVGYGLRIDEAKSWDLYISSGLFKGEPERFCEPGLFLIGPDRTVFSAMVQSMPFARPRFDDVVGALDFVIEKQYPPRGEVE